VDEEKQQIFAVLAAPPVPLRPSPIASRAAAAAAGTGGDDDDGSTVDSDNYLELQDDDPDELNDVVGSIRRRHVLPGQSMPESSLLPPLMPRKQFCPDSAITASRPPTKPPPQVPRNTDRPADSVKLKPTDKPPVAVRKK